MRVAIFGAGSWGTALAVALGGEGRDVTLWARRSEVVDAMRRTRRNPTYLSETPLPERVDVTGDLREAARAAGLWVVATPSQAVRHMGERLAPRVRPGLTVVSVAKGIENDTLMTTTQVLADALPGAEAGGPPRGHLAVVYGPSHAEEVAAQRPTTLVAAASTLKVAEQVQHAFMTPRLRVYANTDLVGVEVAGSVKNVLAIAAGISDGAGYGDNAKAALLTRGLAEIRRLGRAMGARPETFAGLAGIGDVIVTCTSRHSRNRALGQKMGEGQALADIEQGMDMVAEGVRTTASVRELATRHGVEMPITDAVHAVLFEGADPAARVEDLMTRAPKRELRLAGHGSVGEREHG